MEVRRYFWDGLYDADGDKDDNLYIRIDQKSQLSSTTFAMLVSSLDLKVSFNTRNDKHNIYRLTMTNSEQRKNPNAIKKIINIDYNGYLYNFITENKYFSAGVGKLIINN